MTQSQDLTERDARTVAQETARACAGAELYDTRTFSRLCDQVQEAYPSLAIPRLFGIVRRAPRAERRRRKDLEVK